MENEGEVVLERKVKEQSKKVEYSDLTGESTDFKDNLQKGLNGKLQGEHLHQPSGKQEDPLNGGKFPLQRVESFAGMCGNLDQMNEAMRDVKLSSESEELKGKLLTPSVSIDNSSVAGVALSASPKRQRPTFLKLRVSTTKPVHCVARSVLKYGQKHKQKLAAAPGQKRSSPVYSLHRCSLVIPDHRDDEDEQKNNKSSVSEENFVLPKEYLI